VDNLTRKSQHLEVELERTTKQLKEAVAIAGEETAKCKAAKEVIKSLTAQVRLLILFVCKKNYMRTRPYNQFNIIIYLIHENFMCMLNRFLYYYVLYDESYG
jgi:hypothetical protein